MRDERDDARLRALLGPDAPPRVPPFESLGRRGSRGSLGRSASLTLATVLVAVVALAVGQQLATYRQQQAAASLAPSPAGTVPPTGPSPTAAAASLPRPVAQPVTRTSAAAQVAWMGVDGTLQRAVGVDPRGRVIGAVDLLAPDGTYRTIVRAADGTELIALDQQEIAVYSALDGALLRTYPRNPADGVVDAAVSPDGRWLAFMGSSAYVGVLDLRSGATQTTPLAYAAKPNTPGLGGPASALVWSTLAFSPDSRRLATVVNWGGPLRVTVFDVTAAGLVQTASGIDGEGGRSYPGCAGPALETRIRPDGRTLVGFCYFAGTVLFVDLVTLDAEVVRSTQPNPFWQAPIFTPDGQLLYLHQYAGFGDRMQVVDLATRRILGPFGTPNTVGAPGIFSWLLPVAFAGGTPSTTPVSPDGLRIYSVASTGITVLRVPDLAPVARLAEGLRLGEVWVSGDGATLYATPEAATPGESGTLYVLPADGSRAPVRVALDGPVGAFFP